MPKEQFIALKKKVDLMVDMFTPQPLLNKNSKLDPIEEADNMPS